jgi:TonB family protein
MDMKRALVLALAVVATVEADTPALFKSGGVPALPVISAEVGGGEVLLEVSVDSTGAVRGVKALRDTVTFTDRMTQAVRNWRFKPAEIDIPPEQRKPGGPMTEPIDTKVLVAGTFTRPGVIGPTLGEPIRDVAPASADVPFPTSVITPANPPGITRPGVVLVEVRLDADGGVSEATIRVSSPGLDSVALSTARQWKFRPAKIRRSSGPTVVYLVFGFQAPRI